MEVTPLRATPRSRAALLVVVLAWGAFAALAAPTGVPALLVDAPSATALPAPPEVHLATPAGGDGVGLTLRVAGEASSREARVEAVEVRVDGGVWRDVTPTPGLTATAWAAEITLTPGDHLVEARARDGAASSAIARALVRAAATPPATLRILSPVDGAGVTPGTLVVAGTRVGDAPVLIDAAGVTVPARMLPGGAWEARVELPPGLHTITARTTGPTAGLPASVRVAAGDPAPPSLTIATPREGAAFGSMGEVACAEACILFAGTTDASALVARLDGERAPGSAPLVVGGAWTYRLPMSRLYAGEHRMSFTPVEAEREGLAREVGFVVRTPRELNVTGDLAPQLTRTPLSLRAQAPEGAHVRWRVGGALVGEGPVVNVSFARPGGHDVRVEATDPRGRVADVLLSLVALDRAPVAAMLPPELDGPTATLRASATDEDGAVVAHAWEFGDGGEETTEASWVRHRYAKPGVYRANVTAVDELGARSAPAQVLVHVAHAAPTPLFDWSPPEPTILDVVSFRDGTEDPGGRVAGRSWTIDGRIHDGALAQYRFPARGDHAVTLRVRDVDGAEASLTKVVRVRDIAPTPRFLVEPPLPRTGEPVLFADASFDPDGPIVAWRWEISDGRAVTGRAFTHTFAASGEHRVRLTVVDDAGENATIERVVDVQDVGPTLENVTIVPPRPRAKDEVVLKATAVDPEGIVHVLWDFGDGAKAEGPEVAHRWPRSGVYSVNVTVIDGVGQMRSRVFTLSVLNALPAVALDRPAYVYAGLRSTLTTEASDPDGRIVSYTFDADGDGVPDCVGPEPSCAFVYPRAGTYRASVRVLDDEGGETTTYASLDVLTPPAAFAPPRVAITDPAPGATVRGLLRAGIQVEGPRPIAHVDAQLRDAGWELSGGHVWHHAVGGPFWRLALDSAAFPDGAYDLVVRATDEAGAQGLATLRVTLANGARPSEVTLRILSAPDEVVDRALVQGTAYHPDGVTAVRWRIDGGPWVPASGPPLAFEIPVDARGLQPGEHLLEVAAYRGVADRKEAQRVFTVPGAVPSLLVDVPPTDVAYGLLRAAGRVVGDGHAQWRLDHGLWQDLPRGASWRLDADTREMAAGPHVLHVRAVSEDGRFASESRSWRIEIVNPAPPAQRGAPAAAEPVPQEVPGATAYGLLGALAIAALARRFGPPPARP